MKKRADDWFSRAACHGVDPASFFSLMEDEYDEDGKRVGHQGQWDHILKVAPLCAKCPVRVNCFDYVMSLGVNEDGFWAGTFRQHRKRIREMWAQTDFKEEQQDAVRNVAYELAMRCDVWL